MKLQDLFEAQVKIDPEVVAKVQKDCAPYLKAIQGRRLYRGLNESKFESEANGGVFLGHVRNDRRPRDSNRWLHDVMDKFFMEKMGVPARSASLFAVKDFGTAENYAPLQQGAHVIFPIGNFEYAWSPIIQDLYVELESEFPTTNTKLVPAIKRACKATGADFEEIYAGSDDYEVVIEWLLTHEGDRLYKFNTGLAVAPKKAEVMIICDSFYAVNANNTKLISAIYKS